MLSLTTHLYGKYFTIKDKPWGIKLPVWRKIEIMNSIRFYKLHHIIQNNYGIVE